MTASTAAPTPDRPGATLASSQAEPGTLAAGRVLLDRGLSEAEAAERAARGLGNDVPAGPSRTVGQIVRANVVTPFNLLLGSLLAVILVVGPLQDALFGLVILANTATGIFQELRAKFTLERLAVVAAPRARVVREGRVRELAIRDVVQGDLLLVGPGDQVVVDGEVTASGGLEVDESLLTGEAEPVGKHAGDPVLSGSLVVAGTGAYRATRVGREAYAARLAARARRFTLVHSELRAGIDRIIKLVAWVLVPTAALLLASQLRASGGVHAALRGAVAGTVAMVPEGLVLLLSVALAVGVVRLGRQRVLVQELPAVETLARVDVLCFDKTGTITSGDLGVQDLLVLPGPVGGGDGEGEARAALGALAAADSDPNTTLRAIGAAWPAPAGWAARSTVAFSSARKWSAADFGPHGVWVLGAPEVLLSDRGLPRSAAAGAAASAAGATPGDVRGGRDDAGELLRRVEALATRGSRVVLLASAAAAPAAGSGAVAAVGPLSDRSLPDGLVPRALVVLGDQVRGDAAGAIRWFHDEGVSTKVLSGDHPRTVAAVAAKVGVPGADDPVDARTLPSGDGGDGGQAWDQAAALVERRSVFGRVTPEQKHAMVQLLERSGHVVAMTGDGVNDVIALKQADLGIAMGQGSAATRAVAQLVLLDSRFAALPGVVAEGRRVIANIERVARLFVTKTVYATLLAIATGVAGLAFPFLPRHLTLVGSLTIGIPAFFLALEPNTRRARPGFVRRVLIFAAPAGAVAAAASFAAYRLAEVVHGATLAQARSAATLTLAAVGLLVLRQVERPLTAARRAVLAAMVAALALVVAVPWSRTFFALDLPPLDAVLAALGVSVVAGGLLELVGRRAG
jgi:cation-transporting ATPase E